LLFIPNSHTAIISSISERERERERERGEIKTPSNITQISLSNQ